MRYTVDRAYRVTREIFDDAVEVFELSPDVVSEESAEHALWKLDLVVAYELELHG